MLGVSRSDQKGADGDRAAFPRLVALLGLRTVRFGGTVILDRVSWMVKDGENRAMVGANGSGKITLLSLILAGNPQAYANDVRVFDRQRSFSIIDVTHDPRLLPPCIGHVRCLAHGRVKTCKAR